MKDESHVTVAAVVAPAVVVAAAPLVVVAANAVAAVGMRSRSTVRNSCLEICPNDLQLVSEIITVVGYEI